MQRDGDVDVISGKIGIVTVLFNSSPVLLDFFRSLQAQTYINFVVYAIDNASSDASVSMCRKQGERFIVIENENNVGFARGTNQGICRALKDGCEFILMLNNDVAFNPDFLGDLVEGIQSTGGDIVTPLTYYFDQPDRIWAAGGDFQRWLGYRPVHLGMGKKDIGQFSNRRIRFAPGSCLLLKRSVFSSIGMLDEVFFTYWEDADFAVRALKKSLRFYLIAKAKLWHKVSSLAGLDSPFQRYYAVRNHALFLRKHCSPAGARLLSEIYLFVYWLSSVRARTVDPRIAIWKEGWSLLQAIPQKGNRE